MKYLGQFVQGIDNSKGWTICPPLFIRRSKSTKHIKTQCLNEEITIKLTTCANYYGYDWGEDNAHNSLSDCRATLFCYQQIQKNANAKK